MVFQLLLILVAISEIHVAFGFLAFRSNLHALVHRTREDTPSMRMTPSQWASDTVPTMDGYELRNFNRGIEL